MEGEEHMVGHRTMIEVRQSASPTAATGCDTLATQEQPPPSPSHPSTLQLLQDWLASVLQRATRYFSSHLPESKPDTAEKVLLVRHVLILLPLLVLCSTLHPLYYFFWFSSTPQAFFCVCSPLVMACAVLVVLKYLEDVEQTCKILIFVFVALDSFLFRSTFGFNAIGGSFYIYLPTFAHFLCGPWTAIISFCLVSANSYVMYLDHLGELANGVILPDIAYLRYMESILVICSTTALAVLHERSRRFRLHSIMTAMKNAEQAKQSKQSFVETMSHEIRTPLHGILGLVETMELASDENRRLAVIKHCSMTLLSMVVKTLDVSEINKGAIELKPMPMSLEEVVHSSLSTYMYSAHVNSVELDCDIYPEDRFFWLDPDRLKQILNNLVGNAVKFSHKNGHVSVSASYKELGWSPRTGQTNSHFPAYVFGNLCEVHFSVRDDGPGIPLAEQAHVFEPFIHAHKARAGGSGLGLSIVKKVVREMGGSIRVTSVPLQGSTFHFYVTGEILISDGDPPLTPERGSTRERRTTRV